MIELLHLPEPNDRVTWFPGACDSTNTTAWRIWLKPAGISMVSMLLIGSGGGGGGGAANSTNLTAGGGSGGGGGAMAKFLFPAWSLPEKLYVLSTYGGVGGSGSSVTGSAGSDGIAGAVSLIAAYPVHQSTVSGTLIASTLNGGLAGIGGTTSNGGISGTAPTAPAGTNSPLGQMAASQFFIQGTARSAGSTGAATNISVEVICRGAPGGGKTSGAGGTGGGYLSVANSLLNTVDGGTANTGANASSGFIHAGVHYGGCGGGGNNLGVGGQGGNGVSWGSGGGGGGGGASGGRGGDGGPGLVIIACW